MAFQVSHGKATVPMHSGPLLNVTWFSYRLINQMLVCCTYMKLKNMTELLNLRVSSPSVSE